MNKTVKAEREGKGPQAFSKHMAKDRAGGWK